MDEARAFALSLGERYTSRRHWQHAAELMLQASETGKAKDVTRQIKLALFLDGILKI